MFYFTGSRASATTSSGATSVVSDLDRLLSSHIQQLSCVNNFRIPGPSAVQPSSQFLQRHLQSRGLLNDGAVCGILGFTLMCHTIKMLSFFVDQPLITTNNGPDYPVLLFIKILKALPAPEPFSIQLFVQSWNQSATPQNGRAALGVNDDILVCDNVLRCLQPYFQIRNTPVITKYTLKYNCMVCGIPYSNISLDDTVGFACIPFLDIPISRGISPGQLLTNFLNRAINVRCVACNSPVQATLEAEKGIFTLLAFNRSQFDGNNRLLPKVMTKLTIARTNGVGDRLCGEVVSCISHIGSHDGGHWVSYHQTTNQVWWKNDDSRPVVQSNHPFSVNNPGETVNFVVFKNE